MCLVHYTCTDYFYKSIIFHVCIFNGSTIQDGNVYIISDRRSVKTKHPLEYLDYLLAHKQQGKVFDQDNIDFSITKKQGYLPSPDEDEITYTTPQGVVNSNISIDQTPLIQQTKILSDTLTSLKNSLSEQSQELKSAIALMGEAINRPVQISSDGVIPVQPQQNTEQTTQSIQLQREMLETAFEKMVSMQSELFQKTIEELSKTVQTMQEQLRPTGVVRQALSSLKAAQQTTKEENTEENQNSSKEKKQSKRSNKKDSLTQLSTEEIQKQQTEGNSFSEGLPEQSISQEPTGSVEETKNEEEATIQKEDIKDSFDCPFHHFLQGACFKDGIIYSTEGFTEDRNNPPAFRVISITEKRQEQYIPLGDFGLTIEPELIDFCGDTCYYSDNHGNLYVVEF